MKKLTVQILIVAVLLVCSGFTSVFRVDGPYNGKVVDAKTKQPLEGVVVLGVWNKVYGNVAGSTSEFYDSVELRTDKNGEFKISGKGRLPFSSIDEMDLVIYKAGYEMLGYGPWSSFKTRTALKFVQWNGDKPTFLLRKLSYEERRKRIVDRVGLPGNREKLLTKEINKERAALGYGLFKEVE